MEALCQYGQQGTESWKGMDSLSGEGWPQNRLPLRYVVFLSGHPVSIHTMPDWRVCFRRYSRSARATSSWREPEARHVN